MHSWQTKITDDCNNDDDYSDIEDDDDYGPLKISSWGDNPATPTQQQNMDWGCLIDPTVKLKPGGVGMGQLHRSGANYKPVEEDIILAQRMKVAPKKANVPTPVVVQTSTKKKKKKKASTSQTTVHIPSVRPQRHSPSTTPAQVSQAINSWGSGQLTETPFWHQASLSVNPNPNTISNLQSTSNASSAASASSATTTTASLSPSPLSSSKQSSDTSLNNQTERKAPTNIEKSEKKSPDDTSAAKLSLANSPANPPLLRFRIELAPGISTELTLSRHDYIPAVVDDFGKRHQLTISDAAKRSITETLSLLVIGKLGSELRPGQLF
ncbi:hypothetical protein EC973_007160 [Apophysomyces ossiformis]|uniref:Uncharacterized protein n=1 Tax=Apophysomyces ossiformis TaxID=679940 RepID=A0A8H7BYX9_9FUNG|nr:hypothetical protein EC973_007160 [Apophysomyces ossiformis]